MFAGTDFYEPAAADAAAFAILRRPTALIYTGDTSGYFNEDASLRAMLTDVRLDAPLQSLPVGFSLGSASASATTDAAGTAAAPVPLAQVPGSYSAAAMFAGSGDTNHLRTPPPSRSSSVRPR